MHHICCWLHQQACTQCHARLSMQGVHSAGVTMSFNGNLRPLHLLLGLSTVTVSQSQGMSCPYTSMLLLHIACVVRPHALLH